MRKKSIVLIVAMVLTVVLIGCGGDSSSSEKKTEESVAEDIKSTDSDISSVENEVVSKADTEQITDTSEENTEPETEETVEEPKQEEQEYVEVVGDDVRIRSSASTDSNDNIIGKAKKGEKYVKIGTEEDWTKLSVNGNDGFIKTEFVKAISKEEFEAKAKADEPTKGVNDNAPASEASTASTTEAAKTQDNSAEQLAQQQQALLEQQQAVLAQQQQEALLAQQAAAQNTASAESSGGSGTWENTQLSASGTVYITPTGKKYHYDKECAGPNAIPKNISEVSAYDPCKTCVLK